MNARNLLAGLVVLALGAVEAQGQASESPSPVEGGVAFVDGNPTVAYAVLAATVISVFVVAARCVWKDRHSGNLDVVVTRAPIKHPGRGSGSDAPLLVSDGSPKKGAFVVLGHSLAPSAAAPVQPGSSETAEP